MDSKPFFSAVFALYNHNRLGDELKRVTTRMVSTSIKVACIGLLVILFNNCGEGFKAISLNSNSVLQFSPTPTPTATPTPRLSPTPTATPTATPTPRPSPTPTPIGSPPPNAEADWIMRSTGPGVVWSHDFKTSAEADKFRWTGGYGNDPLAKGSGGSTCRWDAADGVSGGGSLELYRPAGTSEQAGWWRPFSPMTDSGQGVPDRGANGTIQRQPWNPTDRGSETTNWGTRGVYGHTSYAGPGYDGTEFFLQMRVKQDPRRISGGNEDYAGGKLFYLTHTYRSLTSQELVTYSAAPQGNPIRNYLRIYAAGSPPLEDLDSLNRPGWQLGSELGPCDNTSLANCWYWSGGWDTMMYHLQPGRDGIEETRLRVYAAHPGEKKYTMIWDETFAIGYDWDNGWNALLLSTYQNGRNMPQAFSNRYDQIIFSKQFIPAPQY